MTPTVFVSDASVEAERIAQVLRSAGYIVADVPLAMLFSRVAVQRPDVVLVDADAAGALEHVAKVRELPDAGSIDFLFVGGGGGPIRDADDALAHEGSAYFQRPVDVSGLVRKVEALTGGPSVLGSGKGERRISTPPPSIPAARPSSMGLSPSGAPSSGMRAPGPPLPLSVAHLGDPDSLPRSIATMGTMSSELQRLLSDAEVRVEAQRESSDGVLPSPEEEIEAVLPAEILAALDEPLEAPHDDGEPAHETGVGAHAKGTTTGAHRQQTTGSGSRGSTPGTFERPRLESPRTGAHAPDVSGQRKLTGADADAPALSTDVPRVGTGTASSTPSPLSVYPTQERTPSPLAPRVAAVPPPDLRALAGQEPGVLPPRPEKPSSAAPTVLGVGEARRILADAITRRVTGSVCFECPDGVRRVVLREGDIVTAASGAPGESLVHYLVARGEMLRAEGDKLAGKVPPFGRHAGAALVAHGSLAQDQLWDTLRGHAEWLLCGIVRLAVATGTYEPDPPGRLRVEPSVFGAVTGAELFIDVVRRSISSDDAGAALGGPAARVADGAHAGLLAECGLAPQDVEIASRARGGTVSDLLARTGDSDALVLVHALVLLGVLDAVAPPASDRALEHDPDPAVQALDEEATRARILARLEVVEDGDYFSILGVDRDATAYEIRRAFLELRRAFEPSTILTPRLAKHAEDVRKIVLVLEEAYDILRDGARRERYRRAIEATPR